MISSSSPLILALFATASCQLSGPTSDGFRQNGLRGDRNGNYNNDGKGNNGIRLPPWQNEDNDDDFDLFSELTMPSFLRNQPNQVKESYYEIVTNMTSKLPEQQQRLQRWADQNRLSSQYQNYARRLESSLSALSTNITRFFSNLEKAAKKLVELTTSKTITNLQRFEGIADVHRQYEKELDVLRLIIGVANDQSSAELPPIRSQGGRGRQNN
ncbi:unnamed protein product [Caenorhabditis auriculariae]|uniref:SXP/RAL-2 family protein Ani s 5-like cation-binding domain-containing protein n=1 Tax=Caenorhabditis auriculariae TaxID=2777116 RepID=A0A8S1HRU8_9PELO|nr:unnamed protein product [Caenorhabditis auriculariae]